MVLDGETLFLVRGARSMSAERRAALIAAAIREAAEARLDDPPEVKWEPTDFGLTISVDGCRVMDVTAADAAFEGFSAPIVAETLADWIDDAVRRYREGRSAKALRRGLLQAAAWTAAFVVAAFVLRRWLAGRIEARVRAWLAEIEASTGRVVDSAALFAAVRLAARGLITLLAAVTVYACFALVLREFAWTRGFASLLLDTLAAPLIRIGRGALAEIPDLITLAIVILVTRYLLRLTRLFFRNIENGAIVLQGFDPEWTWPTHRIACFLIIIAAVVIAYPYIPGSGSQAFQGMTILLGVLISIGSSSVTANMLAGLVVVYKKTLHRGDLVQVGDVFGHVEEVSLLDTHARTLKNELVSIPNTTLLGAEITSYADREGADRVLVSSDVNIGYDVPHRTVERLLKAAARDARGLAGEPAPVVPRDELGEFAVRYELRAPLAAGADPVQARSDLNARILDRFAAARVQIMVPSCEGDPEKPKIPPPDDGDGGEDGDADGGAAARPERSGR